MTLHSVPIGYDYGTLGANSFGPFGVGTAGGVRKQMFLRNTQFPTKGTISALSFRLADLGTQSTGISNVSYNIKISLSYSAVALHSVSTTFASNIGSGLTVCLDNSNYLISASPAGTFPIPAPYNFTFNFTSNFEYDPAVGHLLVDILVRNNVGSVTNDNWSQLGVTPVLADTVGNSVETGFGGAYTDATGSTASSGNCLFMQFTMGFNYPVSNLMKNNGSVALNNTTPGVFKFVTSRYPQ